MLNHHTPFHEQDLLCRECGKPHGEDLGSPYWQVALQYGAGVECAECRPAEEQDLIDNFYEQDQSWRYMSNEMNDYLNDLSGSDDFDEYGEYLP